MSEQEPKPSEPEAHRPVSDEAISPGNEHVPAEERLSATDEIAGRWLDEGDAAAIEGHMAALANEASSTSADSPTAKSDEQRLADLKLLDLLLVQVHAKSVADEGGVSSAVSRVMAQIEPDMHAAEVGPTTKAARVATADVPARRPIRMAQWIAAAVFLILAGVWWMRPPMDVAHATVHRALVSSEQLTDRAYRVEITPGPLASEKRIAKLYVRGPDRFVLEYPSPISKDHPIWLGYDGREAWFVPAIGPVLVRHDRTKIDEWLEKAGAEMPLLQTNAIFQRMENRYELTMEGTEKLDENDSVQWEHVHATRRADVTGPLTIDLWVHPLNGTARRVVLDWGEESVGPRKIQLDLLPQPPNGALWYEHAAHHAPGRQVFDISRGEPKP